MSSMAALDVQCCPNPAAEAKLFVFAKVLV
jgi:hypothetical protein